MITLIKQISRAVLSIKFRERDYYGGRIAEEKKRRKAGPGILFGVDDLAAGKRVSLLRTAMMANNDSSDIQPFSHLPEDIGRLIFELSAAIDKKTARALALVSKEVWAL